MKFSSFRQTKQIFLLIWIPLEIDYSLEINAEGDYGNRGKSPFHFEEVINGRNGIRVLLRSYFFQLKICLKWLKNCKTKKGKLISFRLLQQQIPTAPNTRRKNWNEILLLYFLALFHCVLNWWKLSITLQFYSLLSCSFCLICNL